MSVLRAPLFEMEPSAPITFGAGVALLVLTSGLVTWIPARAVRVDQTSALRAE
jgi:hypothetical protein